MPRYTAAYSSFLERLKEVHLLAAAAARAERLDPVTKRLEIDALCRGAIVLLSSHVEAYIKELGETFLDRIYRARICRSKLNVNIFYHTSKDIIAEIKDTSDSTLLSGKILHLITVDGDFWKDTGALTREIPLERFNKGFANPSFPKIKSYLSRFGYEKLKNDIDKKLKSDSQATINMINHLVDIRNSIAHGDPSATKTPGDIRDMVRIICTFCRTTDESFADWCRSNVCGIR